MHGRSFIQGPTKNTFPIGCDSTEYKNIRRKYTYPLAGFCSGTTSTKKTTEAHLTFKLQEIIRQEKFQKMSERFTHTLKNTMKKF